MKIAKKLTIFVCIACAAMARWLRQLLCPGSSAPGPGEPAKVEAPAAAPGAPAAEAKKDDPGAAPAQVTQGLLEQIGGAKVAADTMWTLIAAMLVFFMNLGFARVDRVCAGPRIQRLFSPRTLSYSRLLPLHFWFSVGA